MEYTGLINKYKINRPLSKLDKDNQLNQKQRLEIKTSHELTVIEINSNYIEVVDKFFYWKGGMTTGCVMLLSLLGVTVISFLYLVVFIKHADIGAWLVLLFVFIASSPLIWLFTKTIRKEANYTHYPMRFNRKTRQVHVFRQDGTVLTAQWDKLFITQVPVTQRYWEFQCHVLDTDGETILETFALPALGYGERGRDEYKGYWEFIRRYMEEGPASVYNEITGCLPIKQQKEPFSFIYHRLAYSMGSFHPFILFYYLFDVPGRLLAMHFCKIPQWPAEIDAQCVVEANDPYFKDASSNPV